LVIERNDGHSRRVAAAQDLLNLGASMTGGAITIGNNSATTSTFNTVLYGQKQLDKEIYNTSVLPLIKNVSLLLLLVLLLLSSLLL